MPISTTLFLKAKPPLIDAEEASWIIGEATPSPDNLVW